MPAQTDFPIALFQLNKGPISVGLTSLRAIQLSGYSRIEALIYSFRVSCKNTVFSQTSRPQRQKHVPVHMALVVFKLN